MLKPERIVNPGLFLVAKPAAPARDASHPFIPDPLYDSLCAAIRTRHVVRFTYGGKLRVAEPHDFGVQNGHVRLLAYQTAGESNGRLPAWRWFDVDKLSSFAILSQTFPGNRPAPSGRHHRWDKVFIRVGEPE